MAAPVLGGEDAVAALRVRGRHGRTMLRVKDATWPWWVFPAIVGLVVGWFANDLPLGWYALIFGLAMFLTSLALGVYQGKTRWQQRRVADADGPTIRDDDR
jgi:hypothetical protein